MPELAEVEFYRRQWNPGLQQGILSVQMGRALRVFRGSDRKALLTGLVGAVLASSTRHGKQMLFRTDRRGWLGIHLGMTGELRVASPGFKPGRHDHLVFVQRQRVLVFTDPRQFGRIRFHPDASPPEWWSDLPVEPHSPSFSRARMAAFLRRHARAPLKAVLLSQEGFPGVGNWMADEILWRARLYPALPAGQLNLKGLGALYRAVRFVCAGALRIVAKDHSDPPPAWLFQHRWEPGGSCPRDRAPLRRATIGGRTTVWCPRCQGPGVNPKRHGMSRPPHRRDQ